jgi:hypothetical protein
MNIHRLKGAKLRSQDLRLCAMTGEPLGIIFYTIRFEQFMVDARAVQRQAGMEAFFGGGQAGAMLANVMGDQPAVAQGLEPETDRIFISVQAAMEYPLAAIIEKVVKDREAEQAAKEEGADGDG